jgi:hypothetical protein
LEHWRGERVSERRLEFSCGLIPLSWILRECAFHDSDKGVRQIRPDVSQRSAAVCAVVLQFDLGAGVALDRIRAGHEEVQQHAEAVDLGRRGANLAGEDRLLPPRAVLSLSSLTI